MDVKALYCKSVCRARFPVPEDSKGCGLPLRKNRRNGWMSVGKSTDKSTDTYYFQTNGPCSLLRWLLREGKKDVLARIIHHSFKFWCSLTGAQTYYLRCIPYLGVVEMNESVGLKNYREPKQEIC